MEEFVLLFHNKQCIRAQFEFGKGSCFLEIITIITINIKIPLWVIVKVGFINILKFENFPKMVMTCTSCQHNKEVKFNVTNNWVPVYICIFQVLQIGLCNPYLLCLYLNLWEFPFQLFKEPDLCLCSNQRVSRLNPSRNKFIYLQYFNRIQLSLDTDLIITV